jgi:DNA polymerase-3 subunit epsilon
LEQYPEEYNARVQNFIDKNSFENQNMLLIDKEEPSANDQLL